MITGKEEELKEIAKNYMCSEHRDKFTLTVAWSNNQYIIRCGAGHFPEEVTRQPTLTEQYKQGEELPEPFKSNVEKSIRKRAQQLPQAPGAETFTGVPATDLGTGELLRIEVVKGLVEYARKYELDPARGHVCLMYGKPYITIDGYLYHAHQVNLPYSMNSRPLKKEERGDYQVKEGDFAWITIIKKGPSLSEFTGVGIVTAEERSATSSKNPNQLRSPVVAAHPWQLAQKRAEWQALRRAFPIGESDKEEGNEKSRDSG